MRTEEADLALVLESSSLIAGLHALTKPGWPSTIVVLRDDSAYSLGIVTGLIVRALPHRDRSFIGVAGEGRLQELWIPLGVPMRLTPVERAAAIMRAEDRARREVVPLPSQHVTAPLVEPAPMSVPVMSPFEHGRVWTITGQRVVVFDAYPDPFREAPPVVLVVSGDDALYGRIAHTAPARVKLVRAVSVNAALEAIALERPQRIVCAESHALGDGGLLERIQAERRELLGALEIICSERSGEWVQSYLAARSANVRVIEDAVEEDTHDNDGAEREEED